MLSSDNFRIADNPPRASSLASHNPAYRALEVIAKPSNIRQKIEVFVILILPTFSLA